MRTSSPYSREYYLQHKDKFVESQRKYYQSHCEERKKYFHIYSILYPERVHDSSKKWQKNHPDKVRAYARASYWRHRRDQEKKKREEAKQIQIFKQREIIPELRESYAKNKKKILENTLKRNNTSNFNGNKQKAT